VERGTRYLYTGKRLDPETGHSDYGLRDYASRLARFTTVDPVKDGRNWYAYVGNDPVYFTDPLGLAGTDAQRAGNGVPQLPRPSNPLPTAQGGLEHPDEHKAMSYRPWEVYAGAEVVGLGASLAGSGGAALAAGTAAGAVGGAIFVGVGAGVIGVGIDLLEGGGIDKTQSPTEKIFGRPRAEAQSGVE
jgi:RHS repeat-associated protein